MSLFGCRRACNEQVTDKTVLPSGFEQAAAAGIMYESITGQANGLFRKAVVLTIRCETCGKVRVVKESNP